MESESGSSVDSNLRFDLYAALAALGVAAFLVVCFWRLYKLTVSARPQDMMMMPTATSPSDGAGLKAAGALRQQDVAALPVFVVVRGADGGAAVPCVECAVCLAEIGDGETGRLLPGCDHRFHVACIDQWLRANSTCPLCRAAAVVGEQGAVETCKAAASGQEQQVAVVV